MAKSHLLDIQDSSLGVAEADYVTAFPAGINAATTYAFDGPTLLLTKDSYSPSWNRSLIRLRGISMGREHVGKGVNVVLGPMMNMGRQAQGGRNWEGFGADPFLSGEAAYETILGLQVSDFCCCCTWVRRLIFCYCIVVECWSASLCEALYQ